jgi:hypothetical protein
MRGESGWDMLAVSSCLYLHCMACVGKEVFVALTLSLFRSFPLTRSLYSNLVEMSTNSSMKVTLTNSSFAPFRGRMTERCGGKDCEMKRGCLGENIHAQKTCKTICAVGQMRVRYAMPYTFQGLAVLLHLRM